MHTWQGMSAWPRPETKWPSMALPLQKGSYRPVVTFWACKVTHCEGPCSGREQLVFWTLCRRSNRSDWPGKSGSFLASLPPANLSPDWRSTCQPAYLPTYLPACLLACLRDCLSIIGGDAECHEGEPAFLLWHLGGWRASPLDQPRCLDVRARLCKWRVDDLIFFGAIESKAGAFLFYPMSSMHVLRGSNMYMYTSTCMFGHVYMSVFVCFVYLSMACVCTCTRVLVCTCSCAHTRAHTCVCAWACVCVYVYLG